MSYNKYYKEIPGGEWTVITKCAKIRNISFNITIEQAWEKFLSQNRKCALSGVLLNFGRRSNRTASLDRIDNMRGYEASNIQWLHKKVNLMKWTHSQDIIIQLCEEVARHSARGKTETGPISVHQLVEVGGKIPDYFFSKLRNSAKRKKLKFLITIDDIYKLFLEQYGICTLSGRHLCFGRTSKYRQERTASIDRIDSNIGYIPGNIEWVDKTMNMIKHTLSKQDFIDWCQKIAKHNEMVCYDYAN